MGACGGRECGGGVELPAAGKAVWEDWSKKDGKDQPAAKDSAALDGFAFAFKTLSHGMVNTSNSTGCKVHKLYKAETVGPAGGHYHFSLHFENPEYNPNSVNPVTVCVCKNTDGDWTDFEIGKCHVSKKAT